jgi:hypothetical protein
MMRKQKRIDIASFTYQSHFSNAKVKSIPYGVGASENNCRQDIERNM